MIHIKQYILTLVALLAVMTQAWGTVYDSGNVDLHTLEQGDIIMAGVTLTNTTNSEDELILRENRYAKDGTTITEGNQIVGVPVIGENGKITYSNHDYTPVTEGGEAGNAWVVTFVEMLASVGSGPTQHRVHVGGTKATAPTPFPITWSATSRNTASIDAMPAGNVEVNVEYYPQATVTDGGVTANTQAKATTDEPLVNVDAQSLTGATKLMYFVSETKTTAPDYDDVGWTDVVPTAAGYTEATDVYVWYYPIGTVGTTDAETYSDGNMNATAIPVSVGDVPTYDVYFTQGTNLNEWSADPNSGILKGETVTITYTGTRKVIGVKAEKKLPDTKYLKWDDGQKTLVATEIPATATKVENANADVTWSAGTYLVEGDVTIGGDIKLSGDVELIIKDGAKLTANKIEGNDISSLSIYGQTKMSGELNVACSDDDAISLMLNLNIHSCKVKAISSVDNNRGGISGILTAINVYGGSVDAEHTTCGYGIHCSPLNIYGGEVKAVGNGDNDDFSYGINGDNYGDETFTVKVYGGKLWAQSAQISGINSKVTLTKEGGFSGKIETSSNGTDWTEYSSDGTPNAPYVRVGY